MPATSGLSRRKLMSLTPAPAIPLPSPPSTARVDASVVRHPVSQRKAKASITLSCRFVNWKLQQLNISLTLRRDAKLGITFVGLGLPPGMGSTHWLPSVMGPQRAAELILTGKRGTPTDVATSTTMRTTSTFTVLCGAKRRRYH